MDASTDYHSLLKRIDNLKMDKFVAQGQYSLDVLVFQAFNLGSYVTHGLDQILKMFNKSRKDANKALLSKT